MKNDLTCGVVRDLLPGYIEGLTGEETNDAIQRHLAACGDCAAHHAAMTVPEEPAPTQEREVQYLKTVRRHSWKRAVLAAVCTVALCAAAAGAKLFLIGTPADPDMMFYLADAEDDFLTVRAVPLSSAHAYWDWETVTDGETVSFTFREGLYSPLHSATAMEAGLELEGVENVLLCGQLIWQKWVLIQPGTIDLFEARTPYAGDAPALGRIADLTGIRDALGRYTHRLDTDSRPYRWTLDFTDAPAYLLDRGDMVEHAAVLLALVDNLEEVGWTWMDADGTRREELLTLEAADALLKRWYAAYNGVHGTDWTAPASVKDCAASARALQQLRDTAHLAAQNP